MPGAFVLIWVPSILWRSVLVCYSCSTFRLGGWFLGGFALVELHSLCLTAVLARVELHSPCFGVNCFVAILGLVVHVPLIGPSELGHCLGFMGHLTSCIGSVTAHRVVAGSSVGTGRG